MNNASSATSQAAPRRHILVIEDEPDIARGLRDALEFEQFEVTTAGHGREGIKSLRERGADLVILDLMLPDINGFTVCEEMRQSHPVLPIIMLTARSQETDKIRGLEAGADDYVTKPFSPRELVSRVKAILRRVGPAAVAPARTYIEVGGLVVDETSRQVTVDGKPVHLTSSEYGILVLLARHPGKAFARQAILSALWDESPVGDERAIDVHIHNMREKLEPDPKTPTYLLTVRGFGYRLREA
jgi:DNA-binding response OmpR family regulator